MFRIKWLVDRYGCIELNSLFLAASEPCYPTEREMCLPAFLKVHQARADFHYGESEAVCFASFHMYSCVRPLKNWLVDVCSFVSSDCFTKMF